jgi:hypothetical protein
MEKVYQIRFGLALKPRFACSITRGKSGWSVWTRSVPIQDYAYYGDMSDFAAPDETAHKSKDQNFQFATPGEALSTIVKEVLARVLTDRQPDRPFEIGFCDYHEDWNWTAPHAPLDDESIVVKGAAEAVGFVLAKFTKKWPPSGPLESKA